MNEQNKLEDQLTDEELRPSIQERAMEIHKREMSKKNDAVFAMELANSKTIKCKSREEFRSALQQEVDKRLAQEV